MASKRTPKEERVFSLDLPSGRRIADYCPVCTTGLCIHDLKILCGEKQPYSASELPTVTEEQCRPLGLPWNKTNINVVSEDQPGFEPPDPEGFRKCKVCEDVWLHKNDNEGLKLHQRGSKHIKKVKKFIAPPIPAGPKRCGVCEVPLPSWTKGKLINPIWEHDVDPWRLQLGDVKERPRWEFYCKTCEAAFCRSELTLFQEGIWRDKLGTGTPPPTDTPPTTNKKKKKTPPPKTVPCVKDGCPRMFKNTSHMQTHFDVTHLDVDVPREHAPKATTEPEPAKANAVVRRIPCKRDGCSKKFKSYTAMEMHCITKGACLGTLRFPTIDPVTRMPKRPQSLKEPSRSEASSTSDSDDDGGKVSVTKMRTVKCTNPTCSRTFASEAHMVQHRGNSEFCRRSLKKQSAQPPTVPAKEKKQCPCDNYSLCLKYFKCQEAVKQHISSGKCRGVSNEDEEETKEQSKEEVKEISTEEGKPEIVVESPAVILETTMEDPASELERIEPEPEDVEQQAPEMKSEREGEVMEAPVEEEIVCVESLPPPEEPVERTVSRPSSPTRKHSRREKWVVVGRDEIDFDSASEVDEGTLTPSSESDDDDFVYVERIMD